MSLFTPPDDDPLEVQAIDAELARAARDIHATLTRAGWRDLADGTGRWIHPQIGCKRESVAVQLTTFRRLDRGGTWPVAHFPEDPPGVMPPGAPTHTPQGQETRVCPACRQTLPLDDYPRAGRYHRGRLPRCKGCTNAARRESRKRPVRPAPLLSASDVRQATFIGDSWPVDVARRMDVQPRDLVDWARMYPAAAEPVLALIGATL